MATITTVFTAVRSFMVSRALRVSRPLVNPGNFTGARQFGNFTGAPRQFANVNPLGGFMSDLALAAVILAIFGLIWLGFALMKSGKTAAK